MDMDFALFRQAADNINDERNVRARFYDKAVKTEQITAGGLPVFKNVTYIEIRLKDNNTEVFNQPANAEKIKRFPREYEMYLAAKKQVAEGTPLEQFAFLSAAELEMCRSRGVFTVEALAALSAEKVQSLCLQNEHRLANLFLQQAHNNNAVADFAKCENEYKAQIEKLNKRIEILQQQIEKSKQTQKRHKKGEQS